MFYGKKRIKSKFLSFCIQKQLFVPLYKICTQKCLPENLFAPFFILFFIFQTHRIFSDYKCWENVSNFCWNCYYEWVLLLKKDFQSLFVICCEALQAKHRNFVEKMGNNSKVTFFHHLRWNNKNNEMKKLSHLYINNK